MFESIEEIVNWIINYIIAEGKEYNGYKSLEDYNAEDENTLEEIKQHLTEHIELAPEVLNWNDTQWNDFMSVPWGEGLKETIYDLYVAVTDVSNWLPLE